MNDLGLPQISYREHIHRELREEDEVVTSMTSIDPNRVAFWPTRRDQGLPELPPPVQRCQRCGDVCRYGWWCEPCADLAAYFQARKGMSMVQIAASGEYDPPWEEWVQDHAPWLLFDKLFLPNIKREQTIDNGRTVFHGGRRPKKQRPNRV